MCMAVSGFQAAVYYRCILANKENLPWAEIRNFLEMFTGEGCSKGSDRTVCGVFVPGRMDLCIPPKQLRIADTEWFHVVFSESGNNHTFSSGQVGFLYGREADAFGWCVVSVRLVSYVITLR